MVVRIEELHSGRVVGKPYLGITSGLLVIRAAAAGEPQRSWPGSGDRRGSCSGDCPFLNLESRGRFDLAPGPMLRDLLREDACVTQPVLFLYLRSPV